MARTTAEIKTADGTCPASIFKPDAGGGPWPAILFYMDGVGIRPAMFAMGERMANHGYYVLLPDLFYRGGPYEPATVAVFTDPALRQEWQKKMATAGQANVMRDTRAFLDFLAAQPEVKQPKVGTTGYCMGGGLSLAAAAFYPDRVAAAASFHGGRLATDAPESPHLLAPKIKARLYVAGAVEDANFTDAQKQVLKDALVAAGVDHTLVTENARHGWVPADLPVHDPAAAERHWAALFGLFDGVLKQ